MHPSLCLTRQLLFPAAVRQRRRKGPHLLGRPVGHRLGLFRKPEVTGSENAGRTFHSGLQAGKRFEELNFSIPGQDHMANSMPSPKLIAVAL